MQIDVHSVTFAYDTEQPVLSNISLAVPSGRAVGLIGPNGSGKSTLLRLIAKSLRPKRGSIHLGGRDVAQMSTREIARCLAMVEQQRAIGFDFTVRDVVAMGRFPYRRRWSKEDKTDRNAIERAMRWAEVESLANRSARALSGGEGQRVFLAMALAQEPQILLLDEPTTFLDLRHQVNFLSIVKERVASGLTVLLSIHDLPLASQIAEDVVLLNDGGVACSGHPEQVLTRENLREIYRVDAAVGRHPGSGMLYVLPALETEDRSPDS